MDRKHLLFKYSWGICKNNKVNVNKFQNRNETKQKLIIEKNHSKIQNSGIKCKNQCQMAKIVFRGNVFMSLKKVIKWTATNQTKEKTQQQTKENRKNYRIKVEIKGEKNKKDKTAGKSK